MPKDVRSGPVIATFGVLVALFGVIATLVLVHNAGSRTVDGASLNASERHGAEVFGRTCGSCHALAASQAVGAVGPNLDYVQPTDAQIRSVIAKGSQGAYGVMPAGLLNGTDAADVAAYVAKVASRKKFN
ncbi:c-type cytochrome [Conexibacter woesei]|uniref:c-type cytochrome n=1 Tax=Conexibacter woesei TaxID=191495 RepID=UPI0003FE6BDC|nr:cytochrome c [Conexibacter woesei]